jgi:hypothetical protein
MARRGILIGVVALVAFTFAIPQSAQTCTVFAENFECYVAGTYPAPKWTNMFDGVSGYVTDEQAHNGAQSFRSESLPNWARWDYAAVPLLDITIYRAAVYLTAADRGCFVGFGFMEPGTTNTGRVANGVHFANDGVIYFTTRTAGGMALGNWMPGRWYEVEVRLDYMTLLADVWIDGAQVAYNIGADPKILPASIYGVEVPLNQFGMFGDNFTGTGTSVVYYDDMYVTCDMPVPVTPSNWGRIKALYGD